MVHESQERNWHDCGKTGIKTQGLDGYETGRSGIKLYYSTV